MAIPHCEDFLLDLIRVIMEDALATKRACLESDISDKSFLQGKLLAYNEVLSTIRNQSVAFGFSLSDFGLNQFDPDRDLT